MHDFGEVIKKVYVLNSFCRLIKLEQFKFSNFRIRQMTCANTFLAHAKSIQPHSSQFLMLRSEKA